MSVPRFWREIPQRYNLQASVCGVCGRLAFPPRRICPTCRRASVGKMGRRNLAGRGVVVECTRVHRAAPGYEDQVPYWIALVATDEGPRVIGQLVDVPLATRPAPGQRVEAAFRRLASDGDAGVVHYGIKWRPARDDDLAGVLEEE
jgi:hypothetical protein